MGFLISIIVPVYQTEKYLPVCVKSIVNQRYKNIEIILVDDGSTDKCGEICDELAKNDSRIKTVHQINKGVSAARNVGIRLARGEYIGFVDSDDYVTEDMYETMLGLAQRYGADIVQCGRVSSNDNINEVSPKCVNNVEGFDREKALVELMCSRKVRSSTCDKLYRKDLFDNLEFNEELSTGEDFVLNYFLINKSKKIIITDKIGYIYYNRSDSCSKGNIKKEYFDVFKFMSNMADREKSKKLCRYWTLRKAMFAMNFLRRMIPENDFSMFNEFRKYMIDARFVLCNPHKYKISNDKHFAIHILLVWLFPWLYIWLIKKGNARK